GRRRRRRESGVDSCSPAIHPTRASAPKSCRHRYRRKSYRSRPKAVPVAEGNSNTGRIANSIESWSSALSSPGDAASITVAGFDKGERPFILIGFPLIGAVLG